MSTAPPPTMEEQPPPQPPPQEPPKPAEPMAAPVVPKDNKGAIEPYTGDAPPKLPICNAFIEDLALRGFDIITDVCPVPDCKWPVARHQRKPPGSVIAPPPPQQIYPQFVPQLMMQKDDGKSYMVDKPPEKFKFLHNATFEEVYNHYEGQVSKGIPANEVRVPNGKKFFFIYLWCKEIESHENFHEIVKNLEVTKLPASFYSTLSYLLSDGPYWSFDKHLARWNTGFKKYDEDEAARMFSEVVRADIYRNRAANRQLKVDEKVARLNSTFATTRKDVSVDSIGPPPHPPAPPPPGPMGLALDGTMAQPMELPPTADKVAMASLAARKRPHEDDVMDKDLMDGDHPAKKRRMKK